jgi:2-dehydro-3-deoxyphosphogluconate aldolase/(4S)-4-hydroxy-2-oxoglutarate aldolase
MTPAEASEKTEEICRLAPVVPVLVIEDAAKAEPLARALISGGLPVLEVTLRTEAALDAIGIMSGVEGGIVGAGTLITPSDVRAAKAAGARFGVSPGVTGALMTACELEALPLLPGAATPSEAMRLFERGYSVQKFFPAEPAGGAAYLGALAAPLPRIRFCPTGGIGPDNAPGYLRLGNVLCVGGSWVAPKALIEAGDWAGIEALARAASRLGRGKGFRPDR